MASQAPEPVTYEYADLGAAIYRGSAPAQLTKKLPALYSSFFCTREYFDLYDEPETTHVCVVGHRPDVVCFTISDSTAEILNKVAHIDPGSVERASTAIFRAWPGVRRIHIETMFPPDALDCPTRELLCAAEFVIALPNSESDYRCMLGRATRNAVRYRTKQLYGRYPDFHLRVFEREEISPDLVHQVIMWHLERMHTKGIESLWEDQPLRQEKFSHLAQLQGTALCGYVGGRCVAANLMFFVGQDSWLRVSGFDRAFEDVSLGYLMTFFSIVESIHRGCERCHLGWGTPEYKQRLGAIPVSAYRVSIYRSRLWRALFIREKAFLLYRDRWRIYFAMRHRLGQRIPLLTNIYRKLKGRPSSAEARS